MTGEMAWIQPDGTDSNGDHWPYHAELAVVLGGDLRPFDAYCGPYIRVPEGRLWIESGSVVLWPGGAAPAYCEPIVEHFPDDDHESIAAAAIAAIERARAA